MNNIQRREDQDLKKQKITHSVNSFKKLKARKKLSRYTAFKNKQFLKYSICYFDNKKCIIKKDLEVEGKRKKQNKVN